MPRCLICTIDLQKYWRTEQLSDDLILQLDVMEIVKYKIIKLHNEYWVVFIDQEGREGIDCDSWSKKITVWEDEVIANEYAQAMMEGYNAYKIGVTQRALRMRYRKVFLNYPTTQEEMMARECELKSIMVMLDRSINKTGTLLWRANRLHYKSIKKWMEHRNFL